MWECVPCQELFNGSPCLVVHSALGSLSNKLCTYRETNLAVEYVHKTTNFDPVGAKSFELQLEWIPSRRTQKNRKNRRATINLKPRTKSSEQGEFRSAVSIFVWSMLTSFFRITFQIPSRQNSTKQNQIRLVKPPSTEVSGPSEVPWFVREFFLLVFRKENK